MEKPSKQPPCPFYGFAWFHPSYMYGNGVSNQCALVKDAHSPCIMQISNEEPDIRRCDRRQWLIPVAALTETRVYPSDEATRGQTLAEWSAVVMSEPSS